MAIVPFSRIVGERAFQETRSVKIAEGQDLPADDYGFLEYYCTDPTCDCRRVIINVFRQSTRDKIWATITYGWDTPEYYAKWSRMTTAAEARMMAEATLEPISPQTDLSPLLLDLFINAVLPSPDYINRLKRHYAQSCPDRIQGPGHEKPDSSSVWSVKPVRQFKRRKR